MTPMPSIKSVKLGGDATSSASGNVFSFAGVPDGFFGTSKTGIIAATIAFVAVVAAIAFIKKKG